MQHVLTISSSLADSNDYGTSLFGLQVSAPSMGQDLIVPLPSIVADTNQQPSGKLSAGSGQPTTMQVQICADSVCSLQVRAAQLQYGLNSCSDSACPEC